MTTLARPLITSLAVAFESSRLDNTVALVALRWLATANQSEIVVEKVKSFAGCIPTTLQACDVLTHRPDGIAPVQVLDLEQARITASTHSVVRSTLRNRPRNPHILQHEVLERDVLCVSEAPTPAVRRIPRCPARPRLDPPRILRAIAVDVYRGDVLDDLDLARVLSDTPHSQTLAVIERAVRDVDVCAVLLHADAVVAAVDGPPEEGDVIGVDGIDAVGVDVCAEVVVSFRGVVDVYVLQEDTFGPGDGHGPHLGFDEAEAFDDGVCGVGHRYCVGAAVEVGLAAVVWEC